MAKRKRHTGRKVITVLACGLIISGIMGTGVYAESVETEEEISVQASMANTETWAEWDTEVDAPETEEQTVSPVEEESEESTGIPMHEALSRIGVGKILMTGTARDNGKECVRVMSGTGESFLLFPDGDGRIQSVKNAETGEWVATFQKQG